MLVWNEAITCLQYDINYTVGIAVDIIHVIQIHQIISALSNSCCYFLYNSLYQLNN